MNERDRSFTDATRIVEESLVFRSFTTAAGIFKSAAGDSRAIGLWRQAARAFDQAPSATRVRQIGMPIAIACATHLALVPWMPRRVAPALPAAWWVTAAVAAAVVAALAVPLTAAWQDRRPR